MVEVHCAHGYLVSTFLSERTNHRTDEFGGCFENRLRLPRLIVENIRRKTGGIMPILCRINASDELDGGQSVPGRRRGGRLSGAGVRCGCHPCLPGGPPAGRVHVGAGTVPRGLQRPAGGGDQAGGDGARHRGGPLHRAPVRRAAGPAGAGRPDRLRAAEHCRSGAAQPARDGQLETLAPCIGCLLGCVPNMLSGRPITCAVNPLVGRELEWGPAGQKKRWP